MFDFQTEFDLLSSYGSDWLILQIRASLYVLDTLNPSTENLPLTHFSILCMGVAKSINMQSENEIIAWALQPAWLHDSEKTVIKQLIRS